MTDLGGFLVEERPLTSFDLGEGIARRWLVKTPHVVRSVILTKRTPGRWSGPPTYLCSCETDGCVHIEAVRLASEGPGPLPAA